MPSPKYPIPNEVALLYLFVNSLDLRSFVEHGVQHTGGDEFATRRQLEVWMRHHGLLARGAQLDQEDSRKALQLRHALRTFLQLSPAVRRRDASAIALVNASAAAFPLTVQVSKTGKIRLQPLPDAGCSGLGSILAQLQYAAETAKLDRLKTCAAKDCRRVFYDRSKPGTRKWCASTLCGNRQKTRAYRRRQGERATSSERRRHSSLDGTPTNRDR
jgi:predicted RNA-binding Zn ribbon-like protein